MFRHPFFFVLFGVLVVLAALHILGIELLWYRSMPLLDSITHFLGGFWIGGMALWFYFLSGIVAKPRAFSTRHIFGFSVLLLLVVGGLWELFELAIGATGPGEHDFLSDTAADLAMDVFGAVAAGVYSVIYHNANERRE